MKLMLYCTMIVSSCHQTYLRQCAIDTLHSAHQGTSLMESRARATVFWPRLTVDIDKSRAKCNDCIKNAPSQPRLPPVLPTPPSTPFEKIVADYCDYAGTHYLVVADRPSGWPEVYKSRPGSPQSGAEGLQSCLRNLFATYGVPEELSSDGGPEFKAHSTEHFLSKWGVHHRISSAFHPQSTAELRWL